MSGTVASLSKEMFQQSKEFAPGMSKGDKNCYPFHENATYKTAIDDNQTNSVQLYSAENWTETTGKKKSSLN